MPRPVLTNHVLQRMAKRGITEKQILDALARPQLRRPGQPGTVWIHGQVDGGRILKVCISADGKRVVTAAWPDE